MKTFRDLKEGDYIYACSSAWLILMPRGNKYVIKEVESIGSGFILHLDMVDTIVMPHGKNGKKHNQIDDTLFVNGNKLDLTKVMYLSNNFYSDRDEFIDHAKESKRRHENTLSYIDRIIKEFGSGRERSMQIGVLEKKEEGWFVKWSDMHSFMYGTHWMWTPLHPDEVIDEAKLKEGGEIEFEFVIEGCDEEFEPYMYAKL